MTRARLTGLPTRNRLAFAGMAFLAVAVWALVAGAAPTFPALTGRVVDNANLMTATEEWELTQKLEALEGKSTDQLVVVTLPSLQGYEIEEFGYQLGRHWGIGQKDKDNGVLLIVAPNERKVRIEVGKRLEPILTDGLSKLIIENTILPRFRRGEFGQGILAGAKDIEDALLGDAAEVEQRARGSLREDGIDWIAVDLHPDLAQHFRLHHLAGAQGRDGGASDRFCRRCPEAQA